MNDGEFIRALESCALPPQEFGHAAHARAAYLYLKEAGFTQALERIKRSIRAYAAHLGKPTLYHETITVAYVALIQQHMCEVGDADGWMSFARANPELLDKHLLQRYYSGDELDSALARKIFLLPRASGAIAGEARSRQP